MYYNTNHFSSSYGLEAQRGHSVCIKKRKKLNILKSPDSFNCQEKYGLNKGRSYGKTPQSYVPNNNE